MGEEKMKSLFYLKKKNFFFKYVVVLTVAKSPDEARELTHVSHNQVHRGSRKHPANLS